MGRHNILAQLYDADYVVPDPGDAGTIVFSRWGQVCNLTSTTTETRTVAQPTKAGILAIINHDVASGTITTTITGGYNQAGTTDIATSTAGDRIVLISVKVGTSYLFRLVSQEGTTATETDVIASTVNTTAMTATNANATTVIGTTVNATSSTATNANATTIIGTTVNGTSMTATNANATTVIGGTVNATNSTVTTASLTNATLGRYQVTSYNVAAAGGNIATATAINYGLNYVNSSNNGAGVILPAAVANGVVEVIQTVNNAALNVYPQASSAISGLGANTALNTGTSNTAATAGTTQNVYFKFVAANATQWYASK
jgi:hypothetical protein